MDDLIPGLASEKLPNPKAQGSNMAKPIDLPLIQRSTIYIHNIQMLTSLALESRFENFLKRMKIEKMRTGKPGA